MALRASRARSFCSVIRVWKAVSSTVMPSSAAISTVRSMGKPKVSYSLKASLPENTVSPFSLWAASISP